MSSLPISAPVISASPSSFGIVKLKQASELFNKPVPQSKQKLIKPFLPPRVFPYPVSRPAYYDPKPVPLTSIKGFENFARPRHKSAQSTNVNDVIKAVSSNVVSAVDPLNITGPSTKPVDAISDEAIDVIVPVLADDADYDDIAADDNDDDSGGRDFADA